MATGPSAGMPMLSTSGQARHVQTAVTAHSCWGSIRLGREEVTGQGMGEEAGVQIVWGPKASFSVHGFWCTTRSKSIWGGRKSGYLPEKQVAYIVKGKATGTFSRELTHT